MNSLAGEGVGDVGGGGGGEGEEVSASSFFSGEGPGMTSRERCLYCFIERQKIIITLN